MAAFASCAFGLGSLPWWRVSVQGSLQVSTDDVAKVEAVVFRYAVSLLQLSNLPGFRVRYAVYGAVQPMSCLAILPRSRAAWSLIKRHKRTFLCEFLFVSISLEPNLLLLSWRSFTDVV
jgi:hypothetical protein